jgi:hypothetical protein
MKRTGVAVSAVLLVAGMTAVASAQCAYQHPRKAQEMKLPLVQAFVPCDAPNALTHIGVLSCKPPQTFNEYAGSPSNGWLWGPNSSGEISFKPMQNRIQSILNPPDSADISVRIDLSGIVDATGPVNGVGVLYPTRRTTIEDRAADEDMTVVDLSLPAFQVPVANGRARVRTSANVVLNSSGFPGVRGCTALELVSLQLNDENDTPFASPGIFVPKVNGN